MTGLEKIREKILAEARSDADAIIGEANARVADIMLGASEHADRLRAEEEERAEKEARQLIASSASAAEQKKKAHRAAAKSAAVDRAYELARDELKKMPRERYAELLSRLVALAALEQARTEDECAALGDAEESEIPEKYEVILALRDRDELGEAVVSGARRTVIGKLSRERMDKLVLSDETADIDGGVILRFGNIRENMSLDSLFAEVRARTEADVIKMLFPQTE